MALLTKHRLHSEVRKDRLAVEAVDWEPRSSMASAPFLAQTACGTLGKSFSFSEPLVPVGKLGMIIIPSLTGVL